MKTTLLTASLSRAAGGVFEIARRTAQTLAGQDDLEVQVFGLEDQFTTADLAQWRPLQPRSFSRRGFASYGYSPDLRTALDTAAPDLVHVHGLWSYPTLAAWRWSRRQARPYVVTLHGMLEPWALQNSRWKKRLAAWLFEDSVLREAACLHVNSAAELANVRAYGLRNPVCVIPNGIDLPGEAPQVLPPWADQVPQGARVLLYLGRLHPKKGLAELIQGWAIVREKQRESEPWHLALAGWDQRGHEAELKARAQAAGLSGSVHFLGPLFGEAKAAALHRATAFVLPSFSEGLPMAALEAWAHRLPVLMTGGCHLSIGFQQGAAIEIEPEPWSIALGLEKLFAQSEPERRLMAARARDLAAHRFTWAGVATQTRSVYQWLLCGGSRPACVDVASN